MHVTDTEISVFLVLFLKEYYETSPFVVKFKAKEHGTDIFKNWLFVKVLIKL